MSGCVFTLNKSNNIHPFTGPTIKKKTQKNQEKKNNTNNFGLVLTGCMFTLWLIF